MKLYPFIEAEKVAGHSVAKACGLLEVSKSAYYERRNGVPSQREVSDAELLEQIRAIHKESGGTYGAPRIHKELLHRHVAVGKRKVTRLMRAAGLEGRCKKRWRKTTVADPDAESARDLIQRHFGPYEEIGRRYVGDITYSAQFPVMCSRSGSAPCSRRFARGKTAHNHRPSRKARSWSRGRNRAGPGFRSFRRLSVASLVARSASRYWCVTAGLECPSQSAITARSVPASKR